MDIVILQIFLGVLLFFIINWIGKHSFSIGYVEITLFLKDEDAPAVNFLIRVLTPLVYILITSAILYVLKLDKYVFNYYMVNAYYIIFRLLVNLITQRGILINWLKQCVYWLAIMSLSYTIYDNIISVRKNLLPDFDNIANELWIIIIVFLFQLLNGIELSKNGFERRKDAYLKSKFLHLNRKYGKLIKDNTRNDAIEIIAYAILIYEDFNRPKVARLLEYITFFLTKKKHSLGIMQFPTEEYLNDRKSVDLGTKKLRKTYDTILNNDERDQEEYYSEYYVQQEIIAKYNGGSKYYNEITTLSKTIRRLFFSNATDTLFPLIPPTEYFGVHPPKPKEKLLNYLNEANLHPLKVLWSQLIGAQKWKNNILVGSDHLFIGSGGLIMGSSDAKDGLYCLDKITGERIWFFQSSHDFLEVASHGDFIYGGTLDGYFYCISKLYGTPVWKRKFPTAVFCRPLFLGDNINHQFLFVITWKGDAFLLNAENGEMISSLKLDGQFRGNAIISDKSIILPQQNGSIIFLSVLDKKLKKLTETFIRYQNPYSESGFSQAEIYSTPIIIENALIVCFARSTYHNHPPIVSINLTTKEIQWYATNTTEYVAHFGNIRCVPTFYDRTLIYANTSTNQLVAISAKDGSVEWQIQLGRTIYYQWSSPIIYKDLLYIGRGDGIIYVVDLKSRSLLGGINLNKENYGESVSKEQLDKNKELDLLTHFIAGTIIGTPIIVDDNLYIGTADGKFHALALK